MKLLSRGHEISIQRGISIYALLRPSVNTVKAAVLIAAFAGIVLVQAASAQKLNHLKLTFPNTVVGTSSAQMIVALTNTSAAPLTITNVSVSGNFSEATNCPVPPKTLKPNARCQFGITFIPTVPGVQTGVLTVTDSGSNSPQTVQLTGTGIVAVTLGPSLLGFGNEMVNQTSAAKVATLTNDQSVPLTISSISVSGNFAQTSNCPLSPNTLAALASCTVSVTFTPPMLGLQNGALTVSDNASNTPQTVQLSGTGASTPIQQVILIIQENRTPDNLFQDQKLINAGANIQNYGVNSFGQTIPLSQIDLGTTGSNPDAYDLGHRHADFVNMCDLDTATNTCKMDGANLVITTCMKTLGPCPPPPNPQFMYVNPADVAPYFQMAETYTFADNMFQTNQGPSFPAHQFLFSGTSAPEVGSDEFAAEDPSATPSRFSGCISPLDLSVELINPLGVENETIYPCFEHQTLSDLLDGANISWRYYASNITGVWSAPTAINHMCVPNVPPPNGTSCTGADYTAPTPKIVVEAAEKNARILSDIANNQLAQVSWVIPPGPASDHAQSLGCGPAWITSIVNAVGNSPYWSNTVIIITWDDWGGWYDHVSPSKIVDDGTSWGSGYVYGFRVPMIVISPYAKTAYISHNTHDFGSILNYIETTFDLPSLGYADFYADNLSDIFQYKQAPTPFTQITPPSNYATCQANTNESDPDDY
jgi:phospholipase C